MRCSGEVRIGVSKYCGQVMYVCVGWACSRALSSFRWFLARFMRHVCNLPI
jgi:hypothetical protein